MGIIVRKGSLRVRQVKEEVTRFSVSCGQAPSFRLKQETQLTPTHGLPQLHPAPPGYLQINLSRLGIWAGLVDEVLQLGFPQWVSPGSHRGVTDRGGPRGGLVVDDLVGAICPSSPGEAHTWTGVVTGEPPECKKRTAGKEGGACIPFHA